MNGTDLPAVYQRFQCLCEAYAENPDILTGLALHETTGQLKQLCASQLQDPALQHLLHDLLRAIPRHDMGEFQLLLGKIRTWATEYGLA